VQSLSRPINPNQDNLPGITSTQHTEINPIAQSLQSVLLSTSIQTNRAPQQHRNNDIQSNPGQNDSHSPLTCEDISILVQQVIQALPGVAPTTVVGMTLLLNSRAHLQQGRVALHPQVSKWLCIHYS